MQVADSAIDRVFNPSPAPARKFGGVVDTAVTLAVGSVCAFGLTLGPAPLNTVATSSAAVAAFTESAPVTPPTFRVTSAAAIAFVEAYRLAAGLDEFVPAGTCADASMHATVAVTPSVLLPPGLAKKSLAPDPAFATVSGGPGALAVTIHSCQ